MANFESCFSLGMFFILPCIDSYQKVDLRVVSFDVPPQEVHFTSLLPMYSEEKINKKITEVMAMKIL